MPRRLRPLSSAPQCKHRVVWCAWLIGFGRWEGAPRCHSLSAPPPTRSVCMYASSPPPSHDFTCSTHNSWLPAFHHAASSPCRVRTSAHARDHKFFLATPRRPATASPRNAHARPPTEALPAPFSEVRSSPQCTGGYGANGRACIRSVYTTGANPLRCALPRRRATLLGHVEPRARADLLCKRHSLDLRPGGARMHGLWGGRGGGASASATWFGGAQLSSACVLCGAGKGGDAACSLVRGAHTSSETRKMSSALPLPGRLFTRASHQQSSSLTSTISPREGVHPLGAASGAMRRRLRSSPPSVIPLPSSSTNAVYSTVNCARHAPQTRERGSGEVARP